MSDENEIGLFDEYVNFHNEYKNKYQQTPTLCFMMVGSFYECYGYEGNGVNASEISEILSVKKTQKKLNYKKSPILADMLGVPCATVNKFIEILTENNYVVIIIDQFPNENPKKRMLHKVTHVITSSTFIESTQTNTNNLMVAYIESNKNLSVTKNNYSIGIAMINNITCQTEYAEIHANYEPDDVINEFNQIYHLYKPSELILYEINNTKNAKNDYIVTNKLSVLPNQTTIFKYNKITPQYTKLSYQTAVFTQVYGSSVANAMDSLNMSFHIFATVALVTAFDYIYQHSPNLLKDLKQPTIHNRNKNMILFNSAQYQLNIIDYNKMMSKSHKSLNNILNNCCTAMGKRELTTRLCSPWIEKETIQHIYDLTDSVLVSDKYLALRNNLKNIDDIERCFRKINIESFNPSDIYKLSSSFNHIIDIFQMVVDDSVLRKELKKYSFTNENIVKFNTATTFFDTNFENDLFKDTIEKTSECYYKEGIHPEIDNMILQIDENKLINDISTTLTKITGEQFEIKNIRGKFHLQTTKAKGKMVERTVRNLTDKTITINETTQVQTMDFDFEYTTTSVKISHHIMKNYSDTTKKQVEELNTLCKKHLFTDVTNWYTANKELFGNLCKFITMIDYVCNNAFNSKKYNYSKPTIVSDKKGYLDCKEIRHPIIERVNSDEYVTNDFLINETHCGNVIYGLNSAGKSSLIKAIALNIVMAQCGLFVASVKFDYSIVTKLFTRISSDDNIYEAESSFVVETKQIANIQKYSNESSLIVADEMCKSTDYMSALCMVLATTIALCKKKAPFLFASHLHEIPQDDEIQTYDNIAFYHVDVETDEISELVYNRKLKNGILENNCGYGITVAKHIINNADFIEKCIQLKTKMMNKKGTSNNVVSQKQSRYNSDVFMDSCMACGAKEKLETHHIIPQDDYVKKKNSKFHVRKNDASNLCVLCMHCHDEIDRGNIIIDGFMETSGGRKVKIAHKTMNKNSK